MLWIFNKYHILGPACLNIPNIILIDSPIYSNIPYKTNQYQFHSMPALAPIQANSEMKSNSLWRRYQCLVKRDWACMVFIFLKSEPQTDYTILRFNSVVFFVRSAPVYFEYYFIAIRSLDLRCFVLQYDTIVDRGCCLVIQL